MTDYVVTIPGLEQAIGRLKQWDAYVNNRFVDAMTKSVQRGVSNVQAVIRQKGLIGVSGTLQKSIGYKVENPTPGSVIGYVGSALAGTAQAGMKAGKDEDAVPVSVYAPVMEYGRKPGKMPPPEALMLWVKRKQLTGSYSIRTHRRLGSKAKQDRQDRAVAFVIARAIGRNGIQGRHFLKEGIERTFPYILANFNRALVLITKDVAHGN